jgi:hypothetical protein
VALVADDLHKLDRLGKIEKGINLGRIEELLALTGSGEKAGTIVNAIQALGQALSVRTPTVDRRSAGQSAANPPEGGHVGRERQP